MKQQYSSRSVVQYLLVYLSSLSGSREFIVKVNLIVRFSICLFLLSEDKITTYVSGCVSGELGKRWSFVTRPLLNADALNVMYKRQLSFQKICWLLLVYIPAP